MNPQQQDALQIVLTNENIMNALAFVFSEALSEAVPQVTPEVTDEVLGQAYRGLDTAKKVVGIAFQKIQGYRKSNPQEKIVELHR